MIIPDVNVLVAAFNEDDPRYEPMNAWLTDAAGGQTPLGLAGPCLTGFVRIVTHPRILRNPAPVHTALAFVEHLRRRPAAVTVHPGPRHIDLFVDLCRRVDAAGNLVPDAYLASIALELDAELASDDQDFARFPQVRWINPLAPEGRSG